MNFLIIGASRGLGKALVEGLPDDGDTVIGVSRHRPDGLHPQQQAEIDWIEVDMANAVDAANLIEQRSPAGLDVLIYNLGIWEATGFTADYRFLQNSDAEIANLIQTNVTAAILLLKRLIPRLLKSKRPQIVLTGSTSALPRSGGREVAFGASKFGLRGIADALREGFRNDRLAVSCLQIGDLNTEDSLSVPVDRACQRGGGQLIPIHDVVAITRTLIHLSTSSFVSEVTLPAMLDKRF